MWKNHFHREKKNSKKTKRQLTFHPLESNRIRWPRGLKHFYAEIQGLLKNYR